VRILYVCTGNINRSAAAHVITQHAFPGHEVRSAATNLKAGKPMAKKMRVTMIENGIPGSHQHRSTALTADLVEWADLVIGFQPSHLKHVAALGGSARSLIEWLDADVSKVPDPAFDSSGDTHRLVAAMILEALPKILDS